MAAAGDADPFDEMVKAGTVEAFAQGMAGFSTGGQLRNGGRSWGAHTGAWVPSVAWWEWVGPPAFSAWQAGVHTRSAIC